MRALILTCVLSGAATVVSTLGGMRADGPTLADRPARLADARRWAENGYHEDSLSLVDGELARDPSCVEAHLLGVEVALERHDLTDALRRAAALPGDVSASTEASVAYTIARADLAELAATGPPELRPGAGLALGAEIAETRIDGWVDEGVDADAFPRCSQRLLALVEAGDADLARFHELLRASARPDLIAVGAAAMHVLGRDVEPSAITAVILGPDPDMASYACEAAGLARMRGTLPALRSRARRAVESSVAAAGAIARITDSRSERLACVRQLRRAALSAPGARNAGPAAAIRALGRLGDTEAIEALRLVRRNAPSDARRAWAEIELARVGASEVIEALVRRVREGDPEIAPLAATALGELRERAALPMLRPLLEDERPMVRVMAAMAFARTGAVAEAGRPLLAILAEARAGSEPAHRWELDRAIVSGRGAALTLARPVPRPTFDVSICLGDDASREASTEAVRRTCSILIDALGRLREIRHIEVVGPNLVVVALREDLSLEANGRVRAHLQRALHELPFAASVDDSWFSEATLCRP